MLIVLDTNVLVSGLLTPFGGPARVIDQVVSTDLQVAFDDRILAEYEDVLTRPEFGFTKHHVEALIDHIKLNGVQVSARPLNPQEIPDPSDLPFAEVALTANADFLVSGNAEHFHFLADHRVKVVSPADFIAAIERLSGS